MTAHNHFDHEHFFDAILAADRDHKDFIETWVATHPNPVTREAQQMMQSIPAQSFARTADLLEAHARWRRGERANTGLASLYDLALRYSHARRHGVALSSDVHRALSRQWTAPYIAYDYAIYHSHSLDTAPPGKRMQQRPTPTLFVANPTAAHTTSPLNGARVVDVSRLDITPSSVLPVLDADKAHTEVDVGKARVAHLWKHLNTTEELPTWATAGRPEERVGVTTARCMRCEAVTPWVVTIVKLRWPSEVARKAAAAARYDLATLSNVAFPLLCAECRARPGALTLCPRTTTQGALTLSAMRGALTTA